MPVSSEAVGLGPPGDMALEPQTQEMDGAPMGMREMDGQPMRMGLDDGKLREELSAGRPVEFSGIVRSR